MVAPRKRPPTSRSPSPKRTPRQPDGDKFDDLRRELDLRQSGKERENGQPTATKPVTEEHKQAAAKYEYEKLLTMRSGGTYIPPAKLRALQAQITDKSSKEYQRMVWEALKKSINGLINKVNTANIKHIVPELFNENLVRGRGLFCRSIMKAQAASLPFTPIYAAMAAIVNTKLPAVGELLVNRLTVQFRKAYKRNDKATSLSSTTFIAHLVNHQVVTEMLAAEILLLLLQNPSDDSVEIAVGLMRNVGKQLEEQNPKIDMGVFEQFRTILHEGDIDKRTQYMIEVLMKVRKDRYKDDPPIKEELDLVEEEDQITHQVELMGNLDTEDGLNVFKYDPNWEENENAYKKTKAEILGEAEGSDEDEEYETESSSEDEDEKQEREMEIKDQSNADLSNLRKKIYLTIKSSGGFEEACHKLMRVNLPAGQEGELPSMIVQCAAQEQTYQKFYGLMAERFCKLNRLWMDLFEAEFIRQHETIHRLSEKEIRITAQLFAHLFAEDAINFSALSCVRVNEDDSNASTRIFLKILLKEIQESISMNKLKEKLMAQGEELEGITSRIFPNPLSLKLPIQSRTRVRSLG
ncbi:armadillo-type protein [Lineolata rhizophorae]|uniref:Pre-mRNA-splicing factor CWC22 n=1 Tax=Lineolata rhizophorae TaxID=578093 RepID=A0A6A6PBL0_9PEZI|nr:armadillo-type protein [Lineolata rhizophorae]